MKTALLRRLAWAWIALATIYFLIEAATYSGLYRWLAELQLWWWWWYFPMMSLLLLTGLFSLPALIVLLVLRHRRRGTMSDASLATSGVRFAKRLMRGLFALAGGLTLIAAGLVTYAFIGLPSATGYPRIHGVGEAERGMPTEGPTQLIGVAPGRVAVYGTYWVLGYRHIGFAPGSSSAGLRGVRYFIEVPPGKDGRYPRFTTQTSWTGLLVEGGLPGAMQRLFRANGYIIPVRYYTLYQSEASMRVVLLVRATQFAAVALLVLGFGFWQRRNVRRMGAAITGAVST
jgi:hypothetical protein